MPFLVQEQLCGVWVTLDECDRAEAASDVLALIADQHPVPVVSGLDEYLPGPRYRIIPSDSQHRFK